MRRRPLTFLLTLKGLSLAVCVCVHAPSSRTHVHYCWQQRNNGLPLRRCVPQYISEGKVRIVETHVNELHVFFFLLLLNRKISKGLIFCCCCGFAMRAVNGLISSARSRIKVDELRLYKGEGYKNNDSIFIRIARSCEKKKELFCCVVCTFH